MNVLRMMGFCAFALTIVGADAVAQDQSAVPTAPYLARVPDPGHWTIALNYAPNPSATPGGPTTPAQLNADDPVAIETVRANDVCQVTFTFKSSPSIRIDGKGTNSFFPTSSGLIIYNEGSQVPIPFYTTTFLFTEWLRRVGASAFDKRVVYLGVSCFHYRNPHPRPDNPIFDPGYGDEVWVDVRTMLPVAAKWNGIEADYSFLPPGSPPALTQTESGMLQRAENLKQAIQSIR